MASTSEEIIKKLRESYEYTEAGLEEELKEEKKLHQIDVARIKSECDKTFTEFQDSFLECLELKKTISDLKYQMKYILYDIETRREIIPGQLQETFKLLKDEAVVPNLTHDQLAYKNIDMLQEKNMDLVLDLRKANEQVENLKNDYQNLKTSSENDKVIFANTSKENKESIKSLQEELAENQSLINQLSAHNSGQAVPAQDQSIIKEDIEMTSVACKQETLSGAENQLLADFKAQSQRWSTEKNLLQSESMHWRNQATQLEVKLQLTNQANDYLQIIANQKSTDNESLMLLFQQSSSQLEKEGSNNCTLLRKIESLSSELEQKTNLLAAKDTETTKLLALNNNEKEAALSEAQTELRILKKQLADTQDNLNKMKTEKSLAKTQLYAIKAQADIKNATTGDAPTCTQHDGFIQTYKNKIAELEKSNFAYQKKIKELQQKVNNLTSQLSSNASNAELLRKDLQKNIEAETEKNKVLQKKNQEISANKQICLEQLSSKEAEFNTERQLSNKKISTLQDRLDKTNEQFKVLNEKLQQQASNLETALKDLEAEKNNNNSLNKKSTQLNTNLEELKSEVENTKTALNIANQTNASLQNNYDHALEYQSKLKEDFQKEIKKFDKQSTVLNKHIEELDVKMNSLSESQNDNLAKEIIEESLGQLRRVNDLLRAQKDALMSINHRIDRQEVDNMKAGSASTKEAMEALSSEKEAAETKDKSLEAEQAKFNEEKANLFVKIGRSLLGFTRMFGAETDQQDAGDKSLVIPQAIQASPIHEEQKFVTEEPQEEEAAELKSPEVPQKKQASPLQEEHKSEVEVPQSDKVEVVAVTMKNETPAAVAKADKLEQSVNEIEMTENDDVELESPSSPRIPKREREDEEEDATEYPIKKMK